MRARLPNLRAVAGALGFALVGVAIVAAALHLRTPTSRIETRPADVSKSPDPLAEELKRCQLIADQAKDDPACDAAWAENRRRFFTYPPASTPAATTAKNTGR